MNMENGKNIKTNLNTELKGYTYLREPASSITV